MSAMLSRYLKDFSDIKPVAPAPEPLDFADDTFGGFADIADLCGGNNLFLRARRKRDRQDERKDNTEGFLHNKVSLSFPTV